MLYWIFQVERKQSDQVRGAIELGTRQDYSPLRALSHRPRFCWRS